MAKMRTALYASAMIGTALLCGAGMAQAQGYSGYDDRGYYDRGTYGDQPETIIVRPNYDWIEKRQLLGRINGEVNPVEYSISRPVNFADLDLSRDADFYELRARVADTARDLCAELDGRIPELRGDRDADRECVRSATRNAMREIRYRYG
jgi:UrcA family protein